MQRADRVVEPVERQHRGEPAGGDRHRRHRGAELAGGAQDFGGHVRPVEQAGADHRHRTQVVVEGPARAEALRKWAEPRNGVPLAAERVYVGRNVSRAAVVNLSDPSGRPRLRLMVDSLGTPSLEFLDEGGKVTARLPEARR